MAGGPERGTGVPREEPGATGRECCGSGPLVVGMDVGGTASRAVVACAEGHVLGNGRAGGGNPVSNGGAAAAAAVGEALCAAVSGVDPRRVVAAAAGLAGGSLASTDPEVAAAMRDAWQRAGIRCAPQAVSDVALAYVSGTPRPAGTVLVCGTGAVAADMRGGQPLRFADGHGWLLGDRGSGYWIGREAVSAVLDSVDRTGTLPPLGRHVLAGLGAPAPAVGAPAQEIIAAVVGAAYRVPPVTLARLAPAVLAAARDGDPTAAVIAQQACAHLVRTVRGVRGPGAATPVVLGGSVLTGMPATPVGAAVRAELQRLWPDAEVLAAGDGAAAAAWLALLSLPGEPPGPAVYDRLVRPPRALRSGVPARACPDAGGPPRSSRGPASRSRP